MTQWYPCMYVWVQSLHHTMPDFREGKYWLYMHCAWWYLLLVGEFSFIYMRYFLTRYLTLPWYQIVVWSLIPKQIDMQVDSHTMRMSSYITKINVVRTSHVYCSDFGLAWFNNPWSLISHHEIMHMQPLILTNYTMIYIHAACTGMHDNRCIHTVVSWASTHSQV